MAGLLALSAALAAFAPAGRARAEQGGVALDWEAPPGCPSRDVVLRRIRTIVGPSLDQASRLRARGRIERNNARYRLTLKIGEGEADAERVIESNSCADLAGAAAVTLGLLVRAEVEARQTPTRDTSSSEGPRAPGTEPGSTAAPETASPPKANPQQVPKAENLVTREPGPPPTPEPVAGSGGSFRLLLRAPLVGLDVGPLPELAPTFGLAAGVRFESLELVLGARVGLGQTIWGDETHAYGADVRRDTAELRACYAFGAQRISVAPCLLTSVALLTAEGVGSEISPRTQHTTMFAAGVGVQGRVQLADFFALVASLGLQLEATRAHVVVEGLREVAELAPLSVTTHAGIEWSL